jgi:hypothetical protein
MVVAVAMAVGSRALVAGVLVLVAVGIAAGVANIRGPR